ncbi:unnamed protein product [Psylliodes chrysocephalus]|uniref:C-type lectin domain-containing protein n=1 Tax=Psylliodes chrysocephalus TaxID=3402493 RepID=A0A9P0CXV2_9CUCU|nr:unnamed protein product [Psylliodes chrysocephala]
MPTRLFPDNYLAAVKLCQQKQMELLAIESQGELEAVTKFVKSLATDNKTCFWTSDSKLSSDKDFIVLSTGEKVSVLNWGSGEPNTNIKYYAVCKSKGGIVH